MTISKLAPTQRTVNETKAILYEIRDRQLLITYGALAARITTYRFNTAPGTRFFNFLGDISEEEHKAGRGLLSALVITAIDSGDEYAGMPGKGYFSAAQRLGRDTREKLMCWTREINLLYSQRGQ